MVTRWHRPLLRSSVKSKLLTETSGTMTGEGVAWHAAWRSTDFVRFARQSGDLAYIEAATAYFDALIGKLHTSPDAWRGWVGPFIYDASVIADVPVADAILINPMLELVESVRSELPDDQGQRFSEATERYIELAEHICAKWIARDTWWESGHAGGYITWDRFLTPDDLEHFQVRDDVRLYRLLGIATALLLPHHLVGIGSSRSPWIDTNRVDDSMSRLAVSSGTPYTSTDIAKSLISLSSARA